MVSISGKPDLSADGADRVIAAAEPLYADLRWGLAAGFFAPVFLWAWHIVAGFTRHFLSPTDSPSRLSTRTAQSRPAAA
jgi:hypothetical protein